MTQDFEDRPDACRVDSLFARGVVFILCAGVALWPIAPYIERIGLWIQHLVTKNF